MCRFFGCVVQGIGGKLTNRGAVVFHACAAFRNTCMAFEDSVEL